MKTKTLAAAALVSLAALSAASAAPSDGARPATEAGADQPTRVAEGLFGLRFDRDGNGEHRGRHHRWRDDDDDDDEGDEGREHQARGGAGPADPNAANAPVPDNGVFTGKARPKVEVR